MFDELSGAMHMFMEKKNMLYETCKNTKGYFPGENEDKDTCYHNSVVKFCSAHVDQ